MIAVISDTHMPKGKRRLPEKCVEKIRAAEAVIHAGDFSEVVEESAKAVAGDALKALWKLLLRQLEGS